jgi:toxin-antitoxin system PIN domain toxin
MIALDTNILIALHRADVVGHAAAHTAYASAGGDTTDWALLWPCVHEFIGIATHSRIFSPPSTLVEALGAIETWRARPRIRFLAEDDTYWVEFERLVRAGAIAGPRVHDARIAALCLDHGVRELWTADRDFSRFPKLRTHNPLVSSTPA